MALIEYMNQYSYIAWIVIGIFLLLIIGYFVRIWLKHLFASMKKSKKEKEKQKKQIVYVDRYLNHDLVAVKDFEKQKFYYEAEGKDFFAKKSNSFFMNLIDIKGFFNRKKKRKHPDKVVLIRMEMNNGQFREFVVKEDDKNGFKHDGKKYIFDLDAKYYVLDSNIWAYDFHESLTMPVKRRIPVNEIKSTMEHSEITEVENAINPVTLERFIKSEIAQGILQGTAIGKLFKVMLILMIIIIGIVGIDFIIDLMDSGLLDKIMQK